MAESALLKLDVLSNEDDFPALYGRKIEKAELFWAKGEEDRAKYLLKELIKEVKLKIRLLVMLVSILVLLVYVLVFDFQDS